MGWRDPDYDPLEVYDLHHKEMRERNAISNRGGSERRLADESPDEHSIKVDPNVDCRNDAT